MPKMTQRFRIYYHEDADQILEREDCISRLVNTTRGGENEIVQNALDIGLLTLDKTMIAENKYDRLAEAAAKRYHQVKAKRRMMRQVDALYESATPEEFYAWVDGLAENEELRMTAEEYLLERTWRNEDLGWNERARGWIEQYLSSGNPYPTTEIRQAATQGGIISEDDSEWDKLRQLAVRMGLTKYANRGSWRLPKMLA